MFWEKVKEFFSKGINFLKDLLKKVSNIFKKEEKAALDTSVNETAEEVEKKVEKENKEEEKEKESTLEKKEEPVVDNKKVVLNQVNEEKAKGQEISLG